MSQSILQGWVAELGLRHQGVLLTVVRGYDLWGKYAPEKGLIREMRGLVLVPFDERELEYEQGFMIRFGLRAKLSSNPAEPAADVGFAALLYNVDGVTVHYIMHVVHACEIIGYCHPEKEVGTVYQARYERFCKKFHLKPEPREEMDARLNGDRVAAGTVEHDGLQ